MGLVLLGCLGLVLNAGPDEQELKKLAGHWTVSQQEHGGKKVAAKDLADLAVEIAGARLTTRERGDVKEGSSIVALDHKAKPAAIILKITTGADVDRVVKGIYKLEGDTLTICVAEPDKDRPTAFASKEGTGHTLLVFKRVKKK
jgi:uncharacterized protein (TIGR03067 family)